MSLAKSIEKLGLNLTEDQVVKSIRRVSSLLAKQYMFPGYDEDDIMQQAMIIAIKQIGQFDISKSRNSKKTVVEKLEDFLYVVINNRLNNFKRDNFCRNNPPCLDCYYGIPCSKGDICEGFKEWKKKNNARMSIHNPVSLNSNEESFDSDNDVHLPCPNSEKLIDGIDLKDIVEIIRKKLPTEYLDLFNKMYSEQKISNTRKAALLEQIREILNVENS